MSVTSSALIHFGAVKCLFLHPSEKTTTARRLYIIFQFIFNDQFCVKKSLKKCLSKSRGKTTVCHFQKAVCETVDSTPQIAN